MSPGYARYPSAQVAWNRFLASTQDYSQRRHPVAALLFVTAAAHKCPGWGALVEASARAETDAPALERVDAALKDFCAPLPFAFGVRVSPWAACPRSCRGRSPPIVSSFQTVVSRVLPGMRSLSVQVALVRMDRAQPRGNLEETTAWKPDYGLLVRPQNHY